MPDDDTKDEPLPPEAIAFIRALARYVRRKDIEDPGWRERRLAEDDWRKRPRKRVLKPKVPK